MANTDGSTAKVAKVAAANPPTLLFSTGPAHSLSACLEVEIDSRPRVAVPGLTAAARGRSARERDARTMHEKGAWCSVKNQRIEAMEFQWSRDPREYGVPAAASGA